MKNIHVVPTEKPSRLYLIKSNNKLGITSDNPFYTENMGCGTQNQYICITSDEEIKKGNWYVNTLDEVVRKNNTVNHSYHKKIILTTDQDLIKDGVQPIDDEFLEWFIKYPSCERVEVRYLLKSIFDPKTNEKHPVVQHRHFDLTKMICEYKYEIIIPKEEPKQECFVTKCMHLDAEIAYKSLPKKETLEEAKKYAELSYYGDEIDAFVRGAKWQQEQDKKLYSEEEIIDLLLARDIELNSFEGIDKAKEWFEQFKKK